MKKLQVSPGRIPAGEREARRQGVLQAAMDELVAVGYEQATMLSIAKRASCSKATLYDWFGNRQGLFTEVIKMNGEEVASRVRSALDSAEDARTVLVGFGFSLLRLLCSEQSIALNRAATQSSELATILLATGRFRVGPLIEDYLSGLYKEQKLGRTDSKVAFSTFYGLVVQDTQIRLLLGDKIPSENILKRQASKAVDQFLTIYALN